MTTSNIVVYIFSKKVLDIYSKNISLSYNDSICDIVFNIHNKQTNLQMNLRKRFHVVQ